MMGSILTFYPCLSVESFYFSLGHTSSKRAVKVKILAIFRLSLEGLGTSRNLSIFKVIFICYFSLITDTSFLNWGLSPHKATYIEVDLYK